MDERNKVYVKILIGKRIYTYSMTYSTTLSDSSTSSYTDWHSSATSTSATYYTNYKLKKPKDPFIDRLNKDGMNVKMEKSGKYSFDYKGLVIGVGGSHEIRIKTTLNFKRVKKPLMEIGLEFFGPRGKFMETYDNRARMIGIKDGWFDTIDFDVDDDVIYDGNKFGVIVDKDETEKGITTFRVRNFKDNKVYTVKSNNIVHDNDEDNIIDIGVIDICIVDDF